MRAPKRGILAGVLALAVVLVGAIPAAAATTTRWATWQPLAGSGGAYTTSVEIAANPAITATMTSDSRAGQVGVIPGTSVWLPASTDVGAKYGSSINQQYLNLRPRADNAASPSTTTYSFANPTPSSGWTFVLGDIDADAVRIQAIGPNGQPLTAAQLGFQGGFNYCAPGLAGKPSCTGDAADVPSWDPTTLTLTGNTAAADTSGASAWFEPAAPISSLSFVFTRRAGFPVYQTWFASIARDITGTVTDIVDGPLDGVELSLTDANGVVVATTTTTNGGTYTFPGYVAADGYTVRVVAPAGKIAVGANAQQADLTDADAVADFQVRDIVPVAVSGRVTDDDGNALAGVTVSIDGGQTTTTDADGFYLFDSVPVGGHTVVVSPLTGYSITDPTQVIAVPADSEDPIENVDFAFVENPTLSGSVLVGGTGVAGVTITATAAGGPALTAVTDANGDYSFPRLPSGSYEVMVTTPAGYTATGATTRTESVAADDVMDVDFTLARLGAIDGVVRGDGGAPIAGVVVTIAGGTSQQLTTDAAGNYGLGDLAPGTYTITVTPPAGTTVVGSATRTVTVTGAGETFVDQDFALVAVVVPPVDPGTPGTPGAGGGAVTPGSGTGTRLPATGLGPETFVWAGAGAAVLALGAVLLVASRRRSRRDGSDLDA
jgi:hypothetical protein